MKPELLKVLACPACASRPSLEYLEAKRVFFCGSCKRSYPIRDGIPVLLIGEAVVEA